MKIKILLTLILSFLLISFAQAQLKTKLINDLCKRWELDSLEVKEMGKKFAPDKNMRTNYLEFGKDFTFQGMDNEITINGKWKLDMDKMQITNYDIDNPELNEPIILSILEITENKLAITSKPMSGNQIVMHYVIRR